MENGKLGIFLPGKRVKTGIIIASAALAALLLHRAIRNVFTVVFGAAVIAFLLLPAAKLCEKKFSRQASALIAIAGTLFAAVSALGILIPILIPQITSLANKLPEAAGRITDAFNRAFAALRAHLPGIPEISPGGMNFGGGLTNLAGSAFSYAGGIANRLYQFALMLVLSYFFLSDRKRILLRMELLLPCAQRKMLIRHGSILSAELRMYIRGQATIALCVGSIASVALMLIGVPGGIVLGAVVGVFNMIPYFGPIIGGIPVVLLALGESWQKAVFSLAALVLVQQIDGMVISPRVMGNATGFSPAVVLISLYAASSLFGIAGLLFAMPALMAIRTLYRVFVHRYEKN